MSFAQTKRTDFSKIISIWTQIYFLTSNVIYVIFLLQILATNLGLQIWSLCVKGGIKVIFVFGNTGKNFFEKFKFVKFLWVYKCGTSMLREAVAARALPWALSSSKYSPHIHIIFLSPSFKPENVDIFILLSVLAFGTYATPYHLSDVLLPTLLLCHPVML